MYMYFEKVNIVLFYIMPHLDTSGTSKHSEFAHAFTVSSCAHKGCTCPGSLVGRVSTPGKLSSRVRSRAATHQSL